MTRALYLIRAKAAIRKEIEDWKESCLKDKDPALAACYDDELKDLEHIDLIGDIVCMLASMSWDATCIMRFLVSIAVNDLRKGEFANMPIHFDT